VIKLHLYKALELNIGKMNTLSFVGGGGKTTTIFKLAQELKSLNKKVLISTTTAMYIPDSEQYDYLFFKNIEKKFLPKGGTISVLGEGIENGKLRGLNILKLEKTINNRIYDHVLIEADGAKEMSIKAPADYEPVVTRKTTITIGMIGLDCLGKRIKEFVHRPELFIKITGKGYCDIIDEQSIVKLVLHGNGTFKNSKGEKILILNKCDNSRILSKATTIKTILQERGFKNNIVIADIKSRNFAKGI